MAEEKKVSEALKKRALEKVVSAWNESDKVHRKYRKKWNADFRTMQGLPRKGNGLSPWQTNRTIPLVGLGMDLLVSRFFQGLPDAEAEGRTVEAMLNEDSMNQLLRDDQKTMGLESVINKFIKDGAGFGLGVFYTGWRTETAEDVPHTKGFLEAMMRKVNSMMPGAKDTDLMYDGPEVRWVDPFAFRWDPAGDSIEHCSYVIEATDESVYQMRKDPSIDNDVLDMLDSHGGDSEAFETGLKERLVSMGLSQEQVKSVTDACAAGTHQVARYWGAFDIDGDGYEEECKIFVIDQALVSCVVENPFWHKQKPFSVWQFDTIPGFFVGRSFVDRCGSLQEEFSDGINQLSDMRKINLRPMVKYRLGSDTDPETLQVAPGMLIGVENMDDVQWYQPPDVTPALMQVLNFERSLFQLVSGVNDVALGQQPGDETATGSTIAQEQTEIRWKNPAATLDLAMERFGMMLISNEQQYRDRKKTIPVKGDDGIVTFKTIEPKKISGRFAWTTRSASLSSPSPSVEVNKLVELKKVTQGDPNYDQTKINDKVAEALGLNPASLKVAAGPDMGGQTPPAIQQIAQMQPDQQRAAIDAIQDPQEKMLLLKALSQAGVNIQALIAQNGQQQPPVPGQPGMAGASPAGPQPAMAPSGPQVTGPSGPAI